MSLMLHTMRGHPLPPLSKEVVERFLLDLDKLNVTPRLNSSLLVKYAGVNAGVVDSYMRLLRSARKRIFTIYLACSRIIGEKIFDEEYDAAFIEELDGLKRAVSVVHHETKRIHGLVFDLTGCQLAPRRVLRDRKDCFKHATSFILDEPITN